MASRLHLVLACAVACALVGWGRVKPAHAQTAAPKPSAAAPTATTTTGKPPPAPASAPATTAEEPAAAPASTEAAHDAASPSADAKETSEEAATAADAAPPASELRTRIRSAQTAAEALTKRVWQLKAKMTVTPAQAAGLEGQINSWTSMLAGFDEQARELAKDGKLDAKEAVRRHSSLDRQIAAAERALTAIATQLTEAESATGWSLVGTILRARCQTAICFDNGDKHDWLGIEPLVELPVGKSFALSKSSLGAYVNNHELRVDLAAGARVWVFRDIVSVSLYISKPLTDDRIRLEGSPFVYSATAMRRPYPGIALGLFFDSLWLGFDRDELHNGDGQDAMSLNTDFPPNSVVSSTWTLTVALQPVTAFRTAIGAAVRSNKEAGK